MTGHEHNDEQLIALHELPASLATWMIANRDCTHGGKYSTQQQRCWRCGLSRECRWLDRVETGIETMQTATLKISLSYAAGLVCRQLREKKHYVESCLCEQCVWLREVRPNKGLQICLDVS